MSCERHRPSRSTLLVVAALLALSLAIAGAGAVSAGPSTAPSDAPGTQTVSLTDGNGTTVATWRVEAKNATHSWINASRTGSNPDRNYTVATNATALAIQWALDDTTASNDTVVVGDGQYNATGVGPVSVDTANVTLAAVGDATLSGNGSSSLGLDVTADGVTVRGFEIRDYAGDHLSDEGMGIHVTASDVTVANTTVATQHYGVVLEPSSSDTVLRNMTVVGHGSYGVLFDEANRNRVLNSTFRSNGNAVSITDFELSSGSADRNVVRNNTIDSPGNMAVRIADGSSGTVVVNNQIAGESANIYVSNGPNTTVRDNAVSGSVFSAVDLSDTSPNSTIVGNTFTDVGSGVAIGGASTNATVADNVVEANRNPTDPGLSVGGSHSTLLNNSVTGFEVGVRLTGSVRNVSLRHNDVSDNANGTVVGSNVAVASLDVVENEFASNANYGLVTHNATRLDATGNWWGSADGPAHSRNSFNESTRGDAVRGAVAFAPWQSGPDGSRFQPVRTSTGDRFVSIQAAVNASSPGETITATAGRYNESVTVDVPGLTLTGSGAAALDGGDAHAVGLDVTAENVTVSGLGVAGYEDGVVAAGNGTTLEDLVVRATGDAGVDVAGSNVTVRNTAVENAGQGIAVNGTTDVTVAHNTLRSNGVGLAVVGPSADVDVGSNVVTNNTNGTVFGGATAVQTVEVTANEFTGNTDYAIRNRNASTLDATGNWWGTAAGPSIADNAYETTRQDQAVGANVTVTPWLDAAPPAGEPFAPVTGAEGGQFASLQAAVNGTAQGTVLRAAAGNFSEAVDVDTAGVTIEGRAGGRPTLRGNGSGPTGIHVRAPNVTVDGIAIENFSAFGILVQPPDGSAANATISDAVVVGSGKDGAVLNAPSPTLRDSTFRSNGQQSGALAGAQIFGGATNATVVNTSFDPVEEPALRIHEAGAYVADVDAHGTIDVGAPDATFVNSTVHPPDSGGNDYFELDDRAANVVLRDNTGPVEITADSDHNRIRGHEGSLFVDGDDNLIVDSTATIGGFEIGGRNNTVVGTAIEDLQWWRDAAVTGSNHTLRNVSSTAGLGLANGRNVTVLDSEFRGSGLDLRGLTDATISDVRVTDATRGVVANDTARTAFEDLTVTGSQQTGLVLRRANDTVVRNASITGSGATGLLLERGRNVSLRGSVLATNVNGTAIHSTNGTVTLRDNAFRTSDHAGVVVGPATATDALSIHHNRFADNDGFGIDNRNATAVLNATLNRWDDGSGPGTAGDRPPITDPASGRPADGSGDAVSGADGVATVRFDPWTGGPPLAVAGPNRSVQPGASVAFDATDSFDDGTVASYEWTFDDGTNATGATATHTFTDVGYYDVTLTVTDADGRTDTATVTVTVGDPNDPPVATDDRYVSGPPGETLTVNASVGVLANDTDPDGDALNASLVSGPAAGNITLHRNGSFRYDTPAATGTYTMSYRAADGEGGTDTATLTVEVSAPNRAPVARDGSYTVESDEVLREPAPGVLANDADPDGDSLTASVVDRPADGTLTLHANGSFRYVPDGTHVRPDSFAYQVADGEGGTDTATVRITKGRDPDLPGSGTADDPYVVTNATGLQAIRSDLDATYVLGSDVDASATAAWNGGDGFRPIGTASTGFTGSFDGNGHVIANLTIDRTDEDAVGLFGAVDRDGVVRNVTLDAVSVQGRSDVGGLAGIARGRVSDVEVHGLVAGPDGVGGVVGRLVGGLLVSQDDPGTLSGAVATGPVVGEQAVGGLVGMNDGGVVLASRANASVRATDYVGGLVGVVHSEGRIRRSAATGDINGTTVAGGLVGITDGARVSRSYATGNVSGDAPVGGLVGVVQGTVGSAPAINRSYAAGAVSGESDVGGLVGYGNAPIVGSYWDAEATGQSSSAGDGGTPLPTDAMTGSDNELEALAIPSHWRVTDGYPTLPWQDGRPALVVEQVNASSPVHAGEVLTVRTTLRNPGYRGTDTITLNGSDGAVLDATTTSLAPGKATTVTLAWSPDADDVGNGTITVASGIDAEGADVHVDAATTDDGATDGGGTSGGGGGYAPMPGGGTDATPSLRPTAIELDSTRVGVGDAVAVSVRVENDGDADGKYTATLTADGDAVASETASVNANWHETLTLSTSFDEPGNYELAVDGEDAGTVTVTGGTELALANVSLGNSTVHVGESVTITATVENAGTAAGTVAVPIGVDDATVDNRSVQLAPGESTTVSAEYTVESPGALSVRVAGQDVGTIEAENDTAVDGDGTGAGSTDGSGGQPAPGFIGALLAVLAGVRFARYQSS